MTGPAGEVFVLLDEDPLLQFWETEVTAFVDRLRAQRTFTSVEVRRITMGPEDQPKVPDDMFRSPAPIIFVVTHGRSPAWTSDRIRPLLAQWSARAAVAVVQLLPQQHWRAQGTDTTEVEWESGAPGAPTAAMPWHIAGFDLRPPQARDDDHSIAVPVLERGADWLRQWSRLLAQPPAGGVRLPALLLTSGQTAEPRRDRPADGDEPVARFRATASPTAFALATRLAATPLSPRMIRAVTRTVVRGGPEHLTEVLTSDLVRTLRHQSAGTPAGNRILYDFLPGIRERLLAYGYRDRTIEVLHVVEDELARDVEAVRSLTRRVKTPQRASYPRVTPTAEPYLRVELAVHLSLGGPNLAAARQLGRALGSPVPQQRRPNYSPVLAGSPLEPGMSDTIPSSSPANPLDERRPVTVDLTNPLGGTAVSATTLGPQVDHRRDSRVPGIVANRPPRNTNFTGRIELLEALHERLRAGTIAVLPEAVHGSGGVGKSQLVIEYVYLHEQDFDLIWWIPAERPAQIQSALAELAARLDLPVPATANTAVPAVLEALRIGRPYSNWLLVFDNAEHPDEVRRFFPTRGPGSIVITSRNSEWSESARSLQVDVFDRRESIELLRRRGPVLTEADANRLAEALGDLPLALEQAAAWRAETGMSADEYLRLLNSSLPQLDETGGPQAEYPAMIAAAWNVSLDRLRDRDPAALRLLQLCAFFAPEPISKVLFSKPRALQIHPELDPLIRNNNRLNQVIRMIGRLSLARIDHRTNSFQMHRLVQRVLVQQMDEQTRDEMRHSAHMLLAGNDPDQPVEAEHWPRYAELYPHIIASGAERCLNGLVRDMVLNEAKYLWRWGDHIGARDLAQRAYSAWIELADERDPDSLRMASWLGFMYFVVGDYAAAAELNARTLQSYRETVGEDQEETLQALGAVAADFRVAGDFAGALERSLTVYERAEQNFGEEEPFTLQAAHNLAVSMRLSGLYGRALQLDEQTYLRLVQIYGTDHPDTLNTFGGINLDRRELGDYVAAHQNQETVVATARRVLKYDDHPALLRQSFLLASFRRKAGLHHEALELSTEVFGRFRTRYGDRHPDTVLASLTVSIDQRVTNDLRTALRTGEQAIEGMQALYGDDHPHTASAWVDLAVTLRLLNQSERARQNNQAALGRLTDRLGESHAIVLAARLNLASDHYELADYQGAHELDVETLARCRELFGDSHPTTLACRTNIALDLRGLGRNSESSAIFESTLDAFRRTLGEDHPATAAATAGVRANCDIDPLPL